MFCKHCNVPSILCVPCAPARLQTNQWLYQALEAEEAAVQQGTQVRAAHSAALCFDGTLDSLAVVPQLFAAVAYSRKVIQSLVCGIITGHMRLPVTTYIQNSLQAYLLVTIWCFALQAQLPPFPNVLHSLVKAAWQSWRELLTRITRSEIRHWIRSSASSRAAWKILKDPR